MSFLVSSEQFALVRDAQGKLLLSLVSSSAYTDPDIAYLTPAHALALLAYLEEHQTFFEALALLEEKV